MTRLSALVKCPPKKQANPNWSDNGSRQTFMQNWPKAQYEPYGNPAYEGYGYPAAGYGQQRRKVVGLDKPKVADPQLFGWEGKQPQLNVVTVGVLNPKSSAYKREVVGALAGCAHCGLGTVAINPVKLRSEQAAHVLSEASSVIRAMEKQAASPPLFTAESVVSAWKTAVGSAKRGFESAQRTLGTAVQTDAAFKKWLDAVGAIVSLGREVNAQQSTSGLINALKFTAYETGKTVGQGVVEFGQRSKTTLDFLTQPWVMGTLAVGGLALFAFIKGGGATVNVNIPSYARKGR